MGTGYPDVMHLHSLKEGSLGILTLDRPERAHAYDKALLQELERAMDDLEATPPAALLVQSTGEGSFCAGADLKEMKSSPPLDALDLRSQRLFTRISRLPTVSIAAIQGPAVAGGLELALACDLRVAGPRARFWLPETRLGILPSAGGTTRLARLIGISRAKAVILGGEEVDAPTALSWGLVHRLSEDPRAEAKDWARKVAERDTTAQRFAKELLDLGEFDSSLARERVVEAILYHRRQ